MPFDRKIKKCPQTRIKSWFADFKKLLGSKKLRGSIKIGKFRVIMNLNKA